MAHIDNLIQSVSDPATRAALQAEVRKIMGARQFGLVFNAHKPESVLLPKFTVRRGDKVRVMTEGTDDRTDTDDTGVWTVTRITNGIATIRSRVDASDTRDEPKDRLVIVREFGDPIYPGLRTTGKVELGRDKPWHTVINGENYHALQALLYPYEGKVDAIYIDPPYNTGARDWKYNNDYVDENDPYRHSKWLSFMEKRLRLAKRLLNPARSVLIVTIDEKEYLRLGMLLEQVFTGSSVQMVTSVISSKGVSRPGQFSRVEEFIFFVTMGSASVIPGQQNMLDQKEAPAQSSAPVEWLGLRRREPSAVRGARPNQFYPIYVNVANGSLHSIGDAIDDEIDRHSVVAPEGTVALWPLRPDGSERLWGLTPGVLRRNWVDGFVRLRSWNAKKQTASVQYLAGGTVEAIRNGDIETLGFDEDGAIQARYGEVGKGVAPKRVWNLPSHNAESGGTKILSNLISGRRFPYPKSLYAVEDTLRFYIADQPDAVVFDFFSGSGTTAHAVARLNRQDGGRRRSVMVTNNEVSADEAKSLRAKGHLPGDPEWEALGICEYITIPRVTAAFTGRTPAGDLVKGDYKFTDEFPMSEGFEENAEFFELTYEDPALVSLGRKFHAVAPLLWMKAGARGPRIDAISEDGWALPEGGTYGVLFDTKMWSDFVDAVNTRHDAGEPLVHAFIVTDSQSEYQQIVGKLDPSLPVTRLYADYLRTFEINTTSDE